MDRKPKAEVEKRSLFKFRSWKKLYKRCLRLRFKSLGFNSCEAEVCVRPACHVCQILFSNADGFSSLAEVMDNKKGLPELLIHLVEIIEYSHLCWRLPRLTMAGRLTANNSWTTRGEREGGHQ